jgi:hypothetical protein
MIRRRFGTVILLGIAATFAAYAQNPNFSGTWRLNVAQSFMANDHPYPNYELTKKIEQSGDTITITDSAIHNSVVNVPLPDLHTSMQVSTDGKEHEIEIPGDFPGRPAHKAAVTATFQGQTLELRQLNPNMSNYSKQRLFRAGDAGQLVILVETHTIYGDTEQRLVFDKAQ